MPKQTKRTSATPGGKGILILLLLTTFGVMALAAYVKLDHKAQRVPDDLRTPVISSKQLPSSDEPKPEVTQEKAVTPLYVPALVNNEVKLGSTAFVPAGAKPEVFLVNETLKSLKIDKGRAIGVDIKDKVALMDFTKEIDKGYGTIEEGNLIKALQMALGQFPAIEKFQIIVDGAPIESLGNIDLKDPIDVIRPGQAAPTNGEDSSRPTPN